jgi:surface antigen
MRTKLDLTALLAPPPHSGHSGSTAPIRTYGTEQGSCQEYIASVAIDGKAQSAHGSVCREPNHSWRIKS